MKIVRYRGFIRHIGYFGYAYVWAWPWEAWTIDRKIASGATWIRRTPKGTPAASTGAKFIIQPRIFKND